MCGESPDMTLKELYELGSPPHVWGKLEQITIIIRLPGITPTCVGKAKSGLHKLAPDEDHPHMCGESPDMTLKELYELGSPPHVWGKPDKSFQTGWAYRITPTCVGKAPWKRSRKLLKKDHPHMCGESLLHSTPILLLRGSPPHVWGKQLLAWGSKIRPRITPTCVGKAFGNNSFALSIRDHPHMCGESNPMTALPAIMLGSPPHVWGKRKAGEMYGLDKRITPTCVGKA